MIKSNCKNIDLYYFQLIKIVIYSLQISIMLISFLKPKGDYKSKDTNTYAKLEKEAIQQEMS